MYKELRIIFKKILCPKYRAMNIFFWFYSVFSVILQILSDCM